MRQNPKSGVAIVLSPRAVEYGKDFVLPEGMPKTRRVLPVLAGQDERGWWYEAEGTENAEIREDTVCYMHVSTCRVVQALRSLQIERARYDLFWDEGRAEAISNCANLDMRVYNQLRLWVRQTLLSNAASLEILSSDSGTSSILVDCNLHIVTSLAQLHRLAVLSMALDMTCGRLSWTGASAETGVGTHDGRRMRLVFLRRRNGAVVLRLLFADSSSACIRFFSGLGI